MNYPQKTSHLSLINRLKQYGISDKYLVAYFLHKMAGWKDYRIAKALSIHHATVKHYISICYDYLNE